MAYKNLARLVFAAVILVLLAVIGHNLRRRYLSQELVNTVQSGNIDKIGALLVAGADPNSQDQDGVPALWRFPRKRRSEATLLFVRAGFNPGRIPRSFLLEAVEEGNVNMVRFFLAHGVDVKTIMATDLPNGRVYNRKLSPLGCALELPDQVNDKAKIITLLRQAGAKR